MDDRVMQRLVLDNLAIGVFTVDTEFRITSFNRQAEVLTGFSALQAKGKLCYEIFRADVCFTACPLKEAIACEERVLRRHVRMISKSNREMPVEVSAAALRDESGVIIGGVESFLDDSARTLLEKQVLGAYALEDVVGKSRAIASLFETLPALARSEMTMCITGETGTGKGLIAKAVHSLSPRAKAPFVTVNCAAIPDNLLESELFGYKKGAFTNAFRDHEGRLASAQGGPVFLDEIGDMPLSLQAKLLQVIEERQFHPLGATQPRTINVRVIAATHRDLDAMVREGSFRADLFFRLKVAEIRLPPLAQRREDIPLLVDAFLAEANSLRAAQIVGVSQAAMAALMRYHYPGNVRELKNIIEYAAVIRGKGVVRPEDLPPRVTQAQPEPPQPHARHEAQRVHERCQPPALTSEEQARRDRVVAALRESAGNRAQAASRLGVSRTTLWRWVQRLSIRTGNAE